MTIDGRLCTESQFVALAASVQHAVQRLERDLGSADPHAASPTFFEVTTAMACLNFARENVAAAVLEVGLGGRLDSTNVCRPEVCAITSISFDHMKQLGDTLAAIAGEKAGIIKPGVPVVSGVLLDEPRSVIAQQAKLLGAPLFQLGVDFDFRRQSPAERAERFAYHEPARDPRRVLEGLSLSLLGKHQAANAACAVAAVLRLNERGWNISESAIRAGLAAARCPARIELVPGPPEAIIDVAHNPASVAALLEVLDERFAGRRKTLIFASSRDKDYAAMLRLLADKFETIVLTRYTINPRAVEAEELRSLVDDFTRRDSSGGNSPRIEIASDPAAAWQKAAENVAPGELICITGSFFLAAELRPDLAPTKVETGPLPVPVAAG
jgi:dihydrofolate synthase/folylpolyglutamate synthase